MRWLILLIGIVLLVSGLTLRSLDPGDGPLRVPADPSTQRSTKAGPVIGGIAPDGTAVWLGIPYAAAPVGEKRWRAPGPARGWLNPREAVSFASPCPQLAGRLALVDAKPGTLVGREDCLYLNVFAPPGTTRASGLPVMVYLHGGGNTFGSASPYDASRFAREQGVVIVSFNYRLGILGWFRHEALRESGNSAQEDSGNFALLDMVAALTWVRENIQEFGGDPARVTLFGQSAGARNIYGLLASPAAEGLFHGAILQSGYPGTFTLDQAEDAYQAPGKGHRNSSFELVQRWLVAAAGGSGAMATEPPTRELRRFLRGLDLATLFRGINRDGDAYRAPALFRDGVVLPSQSLPEFFRRSGPVSRVPLLVGFNRDEMKLFLALSPEQATRRFGVAPAPIDRERYDLLARYHSAAWAASGVYQPLIDLSAAGTTALYAYRFDWDSMKRSWIVDLPQLLGAAHGLELDFLFRPVLAPQVPGVIHRGNRSGAERLGQSMRDYWAGFAYAGRPGSGRSGGRSAWPRWRSDEPRVMILDADDDGGIRSEQIAPLLVDDLKRELAAELQLPQRLRCALYVDLFLANNGLPELFDAREYRELGCAPFPSGSVRGLSR